MDGYISKPIRLEALRKIVEETLAGHGPLRLSTANISCLYLPAP